jgi:cytosine permease
VPQEKTFSGIHIALVMIGGTIAIPVFWMSAQIGSSLGLSTAIPAFFTGSLVLGIMVGLTSYVGAKTHYSTYMITEFAFGRQGAKLVNLIIALALIGWFGVISNVFAQAADQVMRDGFSIQIPIWAYVVFGSVLMIGVTLSGFKGLDKLALILVPLMVLFLFYAAWLSYDGGNIWKAPGSGTGFTFSSAVSAVIGSYIVGVVIQPDYCRFARNIRHAMIAAFFALGISFPLVMTLSAMPSIATGENDLIRILVVLGVGVPAFLLLLLSSWSSNVLNLYSSGLSMATIFTKFRLWQITIAIGVLGTAIAFFEAQDFFVKFLILLGITIPPVAAIYILNIMWVRRGQCDIDILEKEPAVDIRAFMSWALAIGVGYFSHIGWLKLTGVAGLDSIVVASVAYLLLNIQVFVRRRQG